MENKNIVEFSRAKGKVWVLNLYVKTSLLIRADIVWEVKKEEGSWNIK